MGPAICHPQPPARVEKQRSHWRSELEPENDASVVSEVTLVVITLSKIIAEAGQYIINLRHPNGDGFAQRDVQSSANDEVKSIVARG